MNNKLADIVGGKVVLHQDTLEIPCFKQIWNNNVDKDLATRYIDYIFFKHHPDSPYVTSMPLDYRDDKLKLELFTRDWEPTEEVLNAESMYLEFLNTLPLQLLTGSRNTISAISSYLNNVVSSTLDMRTVKEAMTAIGQLDKAIHSMDSLAKQVRKEEMDSSRVQGGSEIGHFEIPKQR
jgi:hypothetical protein